MQSDSADGSLACDACGGEIDGEPAGSGLLLWVRGDNVEHEEPPLCAKCAHAIGMTALLRWEMEEDDG